MRFFLMILITYPNFCYALTAEGIKEDEQIEQEIAEIEAKRLADKSKFKNHFKFTCSVTAQVKKESAHHVYNNNQNTRVYHPVSMNIEEIRFTEVIDTKDLVKTLDAKVFKIEKTIERIPFYFELRVSLNHDIIDAIEFSGLSFDFTERKKSDRKPAFNYNDYLHVNIDVAKNKFQYINVSDRNVYRPEQDTEISFSYACSKIAKE